MVVAFAKICYEQFTMSKSSLISFVVCVVGLVGLFGWMFANDPVRPVGQNGVAKVSENTGQSQTVSSGPEVFAVPRSNATALNNEPVNIVIDPSTRTIPVNTGRADLVVVSSGLRMRAEPSSRSSELGNYPKGAKFTHIRDENGWALVQSLEDGQKGWMFKKYLR